MLFGRVGWLGNLASLVARLALVAAEDIALVAGLALVAELAGRLVGENGSYRGNGENADKN